jgi:hypothetical protein
MPLALLSRSTLMPKLPAMDARVSPGWTTYRSGSDRTVGKDCGLSGVGVTKGAPAARVGTVTDNGPSVGVGPEDLAAWVAGLATPWSSTVVAPKGTKGSYVRTASRWPAGIGEQ